MIRSFSIILLATLLVVISSFSSEKNGDYSIYTDEDRWADSVLSTLTIEEKIGQLFMVAAFTTPDKNNIKQLESLVRDYKIGGMIFFKGSPSDQVKMTNYLQSISKLPLMVGIDAEWGLAMRLDSTINFGYQMPLGAIKEDSLIYRMGREIGRECKRMGIHVNFAPVVDVNNNPLNPVIHMRSFGENKYDVAEKATQYMRGMQDEHILAVAKHFPGHGNTDVDSHLDLPVLKQSKKQMDTLELFPFRYLFSKGVGGVMTAHLQIPAYDTAARTGASLSPAITTQLLRWNMRYKGIIFSDALNMGGVSKYFKPGELELKALLAGNDVLLYSENVPKAIEVIKKHITDSCISQEYIDDKVRRILKVKKWVGLDTCKYAEQANLTNDLNTADAYILKEQLTSNAVTVVKNEEKFMPLKTLQKYNIASLAVGTTKTTAFQNRVSHYAPVQLFSVPMDAGKQRWKTLRDSLKRYDLVIVSLHHLSNKKTSTYGLSEQAVSFINGLKDSVKTVLVNFGTPYALSRFPGMKYIVEGYQDDAAFQDAAAQVLFGGIPAQGKLPVTASSEYRLHTGYKTDANRLQYTIPEAAGMSSKSLERIDSIVYDAIVKGAMPGAQVLVVKNGKVVYNKSFGSKTYAFSQDIQNSDLYDLASITKVAGTTLGIMELYDQGKVDVYDDIGKYLPELKGSNKAKLQIKEILAHQAGLQAWIPFYKYTLNPSGRLDTNLYCEIPNEAYGIRVAERLYADKYCRDTMEAILAKSAISDKGEYRYSDLGFLLMQRVLERTTNTRIDRYMQENFYRPLGLATMTYNPIDKFPLSRIVPTEQDTYFRMQLIHGYVHDPAAAMLGGVAGHAGLFSNANDLAIMMQMLLNKGTYGGIRYFKPETVEFFTNRHYEDNRRGLGWDKPPQDPSHGSPASKYASSATFGHTGFTGTCVWADPEHDLIYIFLSNRVYPTADNTKLVKMNVRTNIHDVIYESIIR